MMATPSSVLSPVVYPMGSQPSPQGTASPQTIENKLASARVYGAAMTRLRSHQPRTFMKQTQNRPKR